MNKQGIFLSSRELEAVLIESGGASDRQQQQQTPKINIS
jgi:hypothetical protein